MTAAPARQQAGSPNKIGGSLENIVAGGGKVWVGRFDGAVTELSATTGQSFGDSSNSSDFDP